MKTMKRMMAVLVVLAMLLTMVCTSAYAEDGDVTLTISMAEKGQTYKLYKMMDLEYKAGNPATFSYTVADKWAAFFGEGGKGAEFVTIDADGYVSSYAQDKDAKSLAAEAAAAGIKEDYEVVAPAEGKCTVSVAPGYYVMTSSMGTLLTVGSVYEDSEISLSEKNALPSIEKTAGATNADIGEEIEYTVTVTAQEGAKGYVVTDDMSGGKLTLIDVVSVTGAKEIDEADYTVDTANNKLTVTFDQEYLNKLADNDTIVIKYCAKLNSGAVIDGDGNVNTAVLTTAGVEKKAYAAVKTYKIDVLKQNESAEPLAEAEFKLYRMNGETKEYAVLTNGEFSWAESTTTIFTSGTDGKFTVSGLGNDTYYLEETKAPAGYNLLKTAARVEINDANGEVTVTNKKGQVLPGTGGMGTTLFYVFGGILMAGAAVLLVSRKRSAN